MTLGEKLSRLRHESYYTQEQLADILGVSRQAISKWESDVAYPETDKLIRLSTLYRVTLDYLVKEDVEEITQPQTAVAPSEDSGKKSKFLLDTISFVTVVLYSLWALLLWVMYLAPLISLSSNNLYQWFGRRVLFELQPTIRALIALGVIAGVYIVPLRVLQHFANRKAVFVVSLGCIVFEIAIFVCALCLIGVCKNAGLESGSVVLVVAISTGVVMLLQVCFTVLNLYYGKATNTLNFKKVNYVQNIKNWFKLHRITAIVLACVLVVGVTLSTVLPLTVGKFSVTTVERIKMGASREKVTRILGRSAIDWDELASLEDSPLAGENTEYAVYYFSPKAEKLIRVMLRVEEMKSDLLSMSDRLLLYYKYSNLKKQLSEMHFQYIKICFRSGTPTSYVESVELNADYNVQTENEIKWNVPGKRKQSIKFIPDEIPYGSTPSDPYSLQAQVYYSDGSYRLSYIENPYVKGGANAGWTVTWVDHWGVYTQTIQQSTDTSKLVDSGEVSETVSYYITKYYTSIGSGVAGYQLVIFGTGEDGYGEMENRNVYGWEKYADKVREIYVEDGVTNIPDNAFKDFVNVRDVYLPSSITTIGSKAFYGCSLLKVKMDLSTLTEIRPYAFAGCTILTSSDISGLYDYVGGSYGIVSWTVRLYPTDTGEEINFASEYNFLECLTDTYSWYYWSK